MSDFFHWVNKHASLPVASIVVFMLVLLASLFVIGLALLGVAYGAGALFGSLAVLSIVPIFHVIKEYREYNDNL